jgi:hypothetical protein
MVKDGWTLTTDGPFVDIMEALAPVDDEAERRLLERWLTELGAL